MTTSYHTLVLRKETGGMSFIDTNCYMTKNCPKEATLVVDKADPYKLAVANPQNSLPVATLPSER